MGTTFENLGVVGRGSPGDDERPEPILMVFAGFVVFSVAGSFWMAYGWAVGLLFGGIMIAALAMVVVVNRTVEGGDA